MTAAEVSYDWTYNRSSSNIDISFINTSENEDVNYENQQLQASIYCKGFQNDILTLEPAENVKDGVKFGFVKPNVVWVVFELKTNTKIPAYDNDTIRPVTCALTFPAGKTRPPYKIVMYHLHEDQHVEPLFLQPSKKLFSSLVYKYNVWYDGNNRNYVLDIALQQKQQSMSSVPNMKHCRIKAVLVFLPADDNGHDDNIVYDVRSDNIKDLVESPPNVVSFAPNDPTPFKPGKTVKYSVEILNHNINVVALTLFVGGEQIRHVNSFAATGLSSTTLPDKENGNDFDKLNVDIPVSIDYIYTSKPTPKVEMYLINSSVAKEANLSKRLFFTNFYTSTGKAYKNISLLPLSQNVQSIDQTIRQTNNSMVHILDYKTPDKFNILPATEAGRPSYDIISFAVHGYEGASDPFNKIETRYHDEDNTVLVPIPTSPTTSHFEGLCFRWTHTTNNTLTVWLVQKSLPLVAFGDLWIKIWLQIQNPQGKPFGFKPRNSRVKEFQQLNNNEIAVKTDMEKMEDVGSEVCFQLEILLNEGAQSNDFGITYLSVTIAGQKIKEYVS